MKESAEVPVEATAKSVDSAVETTSWGCENPASDWQPTHGRIAQHQEPQSLQAIVAAAK